MFPRNLIVCRQNDETIRYFDRWMDTISESINTNFELFVIDLCTKDNFSKRLRKESTLHHWPTPYGKTFQKREAEGYETARQYAISNGYGTILYMSGELFPERTFLSSLLIPNLSVISALFYNSSGELNIKFIENNDHTYFRNKWRPQPYEITQWLNGSIRDVYSAGMDCLLVRRKVFSKISFKYDLKEKKTTEEIFYEDLWENQTTVFVDTSIIQNLKS